MLIIALDTPLVDEARNLIEILKTRECNYKVGLELYLASDGNIINEIQNYNKNVFLDLKFHDIPNTVAAASREVTKKGVWMFNLHVTALKTMQEAVKARDDEADRLNIEKPDIIGVTLLTSKSKEDLKNIGGFEIDLQKLVIKRALLAREAGLDGVVASAREVKMIKEYCGSDFKVICPGIRPEWSQPNDQKRILTPGEAVKEGADHLVVGRPVTGANKPEEAIDLILNEIN